MGQTPAHARDVASLGGERLSEMNTRPYLDMATEAQGLQRLTSCWEEKIN